MAEAATPPTSADNSSPPPTENTDTDSVYECNICFDTAKDAVVTFCGHLFCWPCLHQWLDTRPERQMCPVCKAGVSKDKVIPIFGRGNSDNIDPRDKKLPPRPSAQRTEPESGGHFNNLNLGNFHLSFGIGAFPFSIFASTFNQGDARPDRPAAGTQQYEEEQVLSKIFLFIAFFFAVWLLIA